jgi:TetR/AcrR family transcriptional repressor of nem operon
MAEAGLTSGAFYGHFRGKEDLLTEVVRQSVKQAEHVRESGLQDLDGRDWVAGLLRRYLSLEHWRAIEQGCPIPTLVSELSRAGRGPKRAFANAVQKLLDRIESRLADDPRQRERALAGLALAVGGMSLARAVGSRTLAAELLDACRGFGVEALMHAGEDDRA